MKTKKVYRLEFPNGNGIYVESDVFRVMGEVQDRHQCPYDDPLLGDNVDHRYRYGFSSKKQLRNWVYRKEWLRRFHKAGVTLAEYVCNKDDVIRGQAQCVFLDSKYGGAHTKTQYSILEYFKLEVK